MTVESCCLALCCRPQCVTCLISMDGDPADFDDMIFRLLIFRSKPITRFVDVQVVTDFVSGFIFLLCHFKPSQFIISGYDNDKYFLTMSKKGGKLCNFLLTICMTPT